MWCFPSFNDDLGTPPTWRPHLWRKKRLYANLPSEWPLARVSMWMRHISVLLRVTLYRRSAELSFRGVDFKHLPREVVKHAQQDFDTVCGAVA